MGVERVLELGKLYRAIGPLSFKIISGKAFMLGFTVKEGEKVVVPRTRTVVIKPLVETNVDLVIGADGVFEEAKAEEEVIDEWSVVSETIFEEAKAKGGCYKVVVLGGVDVGKSSFSAFLTNFCLERGLRVAVIDGDIGQADVGPPSCVSLALIKRRVVSLRELSPDSMRFIGIDSPGTVKHLVIWALHSLLDEAISRGVELIIVNTDGWISGPGAKDYKLTLIQALNPDTIVAIQRSNELEHIIRPLCWRKVIKLSSPKAAKRVPFEERKSLREAGYFRFLKGSKVKTFKDVPLMYCHAFSGIPLPEELLSRISEIVDVPVTYAELSPEHLLVVVERDVMGIGEKVKVLRSVFNVGVVRVLKKGVERGLLVGLLKDGVECVAIGLLDSVNYKDRVIKVKTPYEGEVAAIAVGRVKLSEDSREVDKFRTSLL